MPTKSKKKEAEEEFSLISREKLLSLYAGLLRSRLLESFVAQNLPSMRHAPLTTAAAAVAICTDRLRGDDLLAPARDVLPSFVEGKALRSILSALRKPDPAPRTRYARQLRSAIASARKHRRNRDQRIAVVIRGTATERLWQMLLRQATFRRLPVIFVSQGDPAAQSRRAPRHLPAISVDSQDVVAIYRVASEAIAHARRGNGPTLIECIPWQSASGHETDPVARMESYLAQKGIEYETFKAKVRSDFERLLKQKALR
jgi:hypothetical protein